MELRHGGAVGIRKAEVGDVAIVVELSGALFREDAGSRDPSTNVGWPEEEGHEYFSDLIADENSICLLAEAGREVVGYLAGRMEEGDALRPVRIAELESMYVRRDFRSGGIGGDLANEFFRRAKAGSGERLSVTAHAANERAINFYKSLGFHPVRLSLEMGL
jgi:ribosomal protein S18 acetylase RimI-like enzyme